VCACVRVCVSMYVKQSVHLHPLGPFPYICVLRESFSVLKTLCLGEPWPAGVLVSLALVGAQCVLLEVEAGAHMS